MSRQSLCSVVPSSCLAVGFQLSVVRLCVMSGRCRENNWRSCQAAWQGRWLHLVVKLLGGRVQLEWCRQAGSGPRGHVRPDPVAWRRLGLHRSRTTHQDKMCRSSQDTSFLRFSVMTHMSRHIVVAPILSAPLLTDTRRSTVGPGMREDRACVVGGVRRTCPSSCCVRSAVLVVESPALAVSAYSVSFGCAGANGLPEDVSVRELVSRRP